MIHANVVCSDFDRSLDFYTRILGASILSPGVQELDAGEALAKALVIEGDSKCRVAFLYWGQDSTCIDLLQFYEPGRRVERSAKDLGLARFALRVRDFDSALKWLADHGVPLVGGPSYLTLPDGRPRKLATFHDPDGTLLEVCEYLELRGQLLS
jgi:catechol 2,3-dioxygenase-like lactoylglutathione lyase family enzyme